MATLTIPNTLSNGSTVDATELNANFNEIATQVNAIGADNLADGSVTNAKLATGIEPTKVNTYAAFRATIAAGYKPGTTLTEVTFDTEDYDTDSAYDHTTYGYTAPVTGLYVFTVQLTIVSPNSGVDVDAHLRVGGVTKASGHSTHISTYANVVTIHTTLSLTASDVVDVEFDTPNADVLIEGDDHVVNGNTLVGCSSFEGRYLGPA